MLPTCEKKMIFLDPHPVDCFLCNESTGFASWWSFSFAVSIYTSTLGQLCAECLFEGLIG